MSAVQCVTTVFQHQFLESAAITVKLTDSSSFKGDTHTHIPWTIYYLQIICKKSSTKYKCYCLRNTRCMR